MAGGKECKHLKLSLAIWATDCTLTYKRTKKFRDENIFFNVDVHSFMSRTAIILKFKMCLFLDEASY